MIPIDPDERAGIAAEYVIGSLSGAEQADFEHAMERDFALQKDVYYWQDKLLPMARMLTPVEPSPDVWARIERETSRIVRNGAGETRNWWNKLEFWRFSAVAASLAVVILALQLLTPGLMPTPHAMRYVAVLQSPDKKDAGWMVEAAVGGKLRLTPLGTTIVAPNKVLQFWTKAQGASGPTSLGLVPPDRVTEIDVALLPTLEGEQLFELTLEAEGGSTIGRPIGPIQYVGRTVALNSR